MNATSEANNARRRGARGHLLAGLATLPLLACTFEPPSADVSPFRDLPTHLPESPLVESSSRKVFEDLDGLVAFHGFGCAESDEPDRQKYLRVKQSQQILRTMDSAAVILSGWQFRYLEGGHELNFLGTAIGGIRRIALDDGNHALEWDAYGVIADANFDDPYRWCYRFTVLAWTTTTMRRISTRVTVLRSKGTSVAGKCRSGGRRRSRSILPSSRSIPSEAAPTP